MFDWIKNIGKEVPEFWKTYVAKFDSKTTRFVVISSETNGLNIENTAIISVAGIGIVNNSIALNDSFEIKINYEKEIVKVVQQSSIAELNPFDALQAFIEFIGNATLVGFHIHLEVQILNESLSKLHCGKLKNDVFDLEVMHKKYEEIVEDKFTLNELFTIYKIEKSNRNSTAHEAFSMALLFLKLKGRLKI